MGNDFLSLDFQAFVLEVFIERVQRFLHSEDILFLSIGAVVLFYEASGFGINVLDTSFDIEFHPSWIDPLIVRTSVILLLAQVVPLPVREYLAQNMHIAEVLLEYIPLGILRQIIRYLSFPAFPYHQIFQLR